MCCVHCHGVKEAGRIPSDERVKAFLMVRIQRLAGLVLPAFAALALVAPLQAVRAEAPAVDDGLSALAAMSLEDLTDIDISSVSKRLEKRSDAAAAIHVITQEDIRRSTAVSL